MLPRESAAHEMCLMTWFQTLPERRSGFMRSAITLSLVLAFSMGWQLFITLSACGYGRL